MEVPQKDSELWKKAEMVLEEHVRPYLKTDGGDVKIISISNEGIIKIQFLGSCDSCALKPMTLRAGIERALMHYIPGIKRIEAIS